MRDDQTLDQTYWFLFDQEAERIAKTHLDGLFIKTYRYCVNSKQGSERKGVCWSNS